MRRAKRVISAILCVCLAAGLAPTGRAVWGSWSWGSLGAVEESTVAPGTIYREISAETSAGPQRMHTVEFDPKSETVQLRAGKSRGNVYGVQTVLGITNEMEKDFPGQVVAGVNGDFFDLGVGVPFGVFMDDGKILSTPPQYSSSFGIKNDGTPFVLTHGTILNKILVIDEKKIEMSGVNNRIKDADSLMMYTVDYGASTRVKAESLEVVCEVLSGEPRHGDTMQLRVAEIHSDVGNTAISEGYIVLSATGARREEIAALQVGQEISAFFQFAQFWQDVKFAVGGNYTVLKDGEIQDVSDGARNPRTLVGYKEDGTVVLCTVDGRQKNYSAGATLKQAATVLKDMGCAAALNLDGGGSTTFVLRPAGSMTRRVMNSPSEGSQRQVANALVLINTAEKQTAPTALFVSPNGQKILAGGTYTYTVAGAMDENYQPHEVNGPISWQASGEVGSIDENGVFTAASAGSAQISAEYLGASGSASAEVVDTLNAIEAEYDRLTLEPEEEKEISVTARHDGAKVAHSAGQLTWAVDEAVGTVVSPGVIKAGKKYAEGKIYVSYKGTVLEIPVTVNGEKEIEFSDMEAHA